MSQGIPDAAPRPLALLPLASLDPRDRALVAEAREASRSAHAPYSNFLVGAAVRAADGTVTSGCNVENASYGVTLCAEIGAVMAAVRHRRLPIEAIAVYGAAGGPDAPRAGGGRPLAPCGRCRQVIAEMALLGRRDIRIICSDPAGKTALVGTAADFLPGGLDDELIRSVAAFGAPGPTGPGG